jgi:Spy/CpxP family protein refolding chaperone
MKVLKTLNPSMLRPLALSLLIAGAGVAAQQAVHANTIDAGGRTLAAADGTPVDSASPGAAAGAPGARAGGRPMHDRGERGQRGPRGESRHAQGPRAHFADLQLTEAQRDKLFELRHAQAPAMRAQLKELRAARTELRALAMSDRYDEARAAQLGDRAAKAQTRLALLQAKGQNEFYKVLTPEQRQKLEARRAERGGFHGHGRRG